VQDVVDELCRVSNPSPQVDELQRIEAMAKSD
jgi:hypothetical protein